MWSFQVSDVNVDGSLVARAWYVPLNCVKPQPWWCQMWGSSRYLSALYDRRSLRDFQHYQRIYSVIQNWLNWTGSLNLQCSTVTIPPARAIFERQYLILKISYITTLRFSLGKKCISNGSDNRRTDSTLIPFATIIRYKDLPTLNHQVKGHLTFPYDCGCGRRGSSCSNGIVRLRLA